MRRTALRQVSDKARIRENGMRDVRRAVKLRSGYRCVGCGAYVSEGYGEVHHVAMRRRLTRELSDDPRLLVWLCKPCHAFVTDTPDGPLDRRLLREAIERLRGMPCPESDADGHMGQLRAIERMGDWR